MNKINAGMGGMCLYTILSRRGNILFLFSGRGSQKRKSEETLDYEWNHTRQEAEEVSESLSASTSEKRDFHAGIHQHLPYKKL